MAKIKISRRKSYKEQLALYLNLTKNLNAKLKRLFKKVARTASRKYAQGVFVDDIFFLEFSDELYKILANQYRSVMRASAKKIIKQRYKQTDVEIDSMVEAYIITHTALEVTRISNTTRKLLSATIMKGIEAGDSIEIISNNIKKSTAFSTARSTLIARTETHSAMNAGNDGISRTLELNRPVKQWNASLDERTRSWHRNMNNKKAIPIDDVFIVPTPTKNGVIKYRMRYTGDQNGGAANVCNCRCFTLYFDEDDIITA
tara:strand:- start:7922 stop:8698 length:777 start_codon:yes stop_codon:yes gene_type:complete